MSDVPATTPPRHEPTVAPDAAELAGRLRLAIARLARQLRKTSESDLSPTQVATLATVDTSGPVTLGELAELERVAPPSITKAVQRLEEQGLVVKTTDADDRRFVRVSISPAGRDLLQRNRSRKNAWLARRLRELDDDARARLAEAAPILEALAGITHEVTEEDAR